MDVRTLERFWIGLRPDVHDHLIFAHAAAQLAAQQKSESTKHLLFADRLVLAERFAKSLR